MWQNLVQNVLPQSTRRKVWLNYDEMKTKETTKKLIIPEHIASGRKSWWSSITIYRYTYIFYCWTYVFWCLPKADRCDWSWLHLEFDPHHIIFACRWAAKWDWFHQAWQGERWAAGQLKQHIYMFFFLLKLLF
jgi:hypothetical protein